jgi:hypothetical protein
MRLLYIICKGLYKGSHCLLKLTDKKNMSFSSMQDLIVFILLHVFLFHARFYSAYCSTCFSFYATSENA